MRASMAARQDTPQIFRPGQSMLPRPELLKKVMLLLSYFG